MTVLIFILSSQYFYRGSGEEKPQYVMMNSIYHRKLRKADDTLVAGETWIPDTEREEMDKYTPLAPYTFVFNINNKSLCKSDANGTDGHPNVVIFVYTAPHNWQQRQVIRETWGNASVLEQVQGLLLFPLGLSRNTLVNNYVLWESAEYGDILQGSFIDSYQNLTYKAIMTIKWLRLYCRKVKFVVKVDIDIFVNVEALVPFLLQTYHDEKHFFGCRVNWRSKVLRPGEWCGKWCVSKKDYSSDYYPPYCWGSAYVMSADLIFPIYRTMRHVAPWWVSDVFLTGIIPHYLNYKTGLHVTHIILNDYLILDIQHFFERLKHHGHTALFGFVRNESDVRRAWDIH